MGKITLVYPWSVSIMICHEHGATFTPNITLVTLKGHKCVLMTGNLARIPLNISLTDIQRTERTNNHSCKNVFIFWRRVAIVSKGKIQN